MKFTVEISEQDIQDVIDRVVRITPSGNISYELRRIIDNAINKSISSKIEEAFPLSISAEVEEIIKNEIVKASAKKIPGWMNRRIKEMLHAVQLQFNGESNEH